MDMKPNIELHIDELVLHGFKPGDRHRIGEAVELELMRLLGEKGVPPSLAGGGEIPRLDGGAFEAMPGEKPRDIGGRVARAVYCSMEQGSYQKGLHK